MTKKDYYDDVNILYSFTSEAGNGYCVKRWNRGFDPQASEPEFNGMISAMWTYLDDDFRPNVDFIKKKREMKEEAMRNTELSPKSYLENNLHIKRKIVTDEAIVAKFSLIQNDLSNKTLIFIQLEKLKEKINEGEIDMERTHAMLETLLI